MKKNSIMKGYPKKEEHFSFAPDLIAQANVKGLAIPYEFHSHQQFEVYVLQEGKGQYLINNQIVELHPGMVILLDGTELHKVQVTGNEKEYVRSHIHFDPKWLEDLIAGSNSSYLLDYFKAFHHRIFTFDKQEDLNEVISLIEKLSHITQSEQSGVDEADGRITLLYLLMKVYRSEKSDVMKDSFAKTDKAIMAEEIASYVQQHFNQKMTIKGIAQALNLSESYVSHLFKEVTGYTVMEYLMNYRLIQAKAYMGLAPLESTIKECALECGFESDAHFNRFFKKRTGMTPKQYKKKIITERE
ncbi:AraC-type DNA-binding protein [Alkalibacterium subtropicum]|uniref:AraC-type DNA-binding protein n=1 Tax=Alkalibacterium subtropicum TaxID=753702 RepID=A0A1I1FDD7_9LACT|nr:AraC family transcriptional regulator [Alkalibacterium subtropicum]SFB97499.1 AraC-type DNA-binding protein [Alkalibacterium subtropicum]